MFNKIKAQAHLDSLLKKHKITVVKWSTTSCGTAWFKSRTVKIPKPTNTDRFCVAMHEIKHIIDGRKGTRFEREFECDMFAREQALLLGFDKIDAWDKRTNWHVLSRIAMAHNRGLKPNKINSKIRNWFKDVDFNLWIGKKIFVSYAKNENDGYKIEYAENLTRAEISLLLAKQNLYLYKSEFDDSTYGKWLVSDKPEQQCPAYEFNTLSDIVKHYKLKKELTADEVIKPTIEVKRKKRVPTITEYRKAHTYLHDLYEQVEEHGQIVLNKDSFYWPVIKSLFDTADIYCKDCGRPAKMTWVDNKNGKSEQFHTDKHGNTVCPECSVK